jgi:hypothetical protein
VRAHALAEPGCRGVMAGPGTRTGGLLIGSDVGRAEHQAGARHTDRFADTAVAHS